MRVSGVQEPADGRNQLWGTFIDEGGNTGLLDDVTAACSVTHHTTPVVRGRYRATMRIENTACRRSRRAHSHGTWEAASRSDTRPVPPT